MAAPATKTEILDVNRRYHDVAADEYDAKWGISFAENGQEQVVGKLAKLLGARPGPFARSLEIGAGTGYFSLNMLQAGVVGAATCTDISPGMLATLEANAARLGLEVETAACDAAALPFEDESFDLVFGHAVLHHLPELERCLRRVPPRAAPGRDAVLRRRAVAPGRPHRRLAQARRVADLARLARRAAGAEGAAPQRAPDGRRRRPPPRVPGRRARVRARRPRAPRRRRGLRAVRVRGEELLANWFGWFNRTLEASADPKGIPMPWIHYAHRGYLLLQGVDRRLLEGRLPPQLFYNLMLAAPSP